MQTSARTDLVFHGPVDGSQKFENCGDPSDHGGLGHLDTPSLELGGDAVERQVVQVLGEHDPGHQVGGGDSLVDDADHRVGLGHTALGALTAGVTGTDVAMLYETGGGEGQAFAPLLSN